MVQYGLNCIGGRIGSSGLDSMTYDLELGNVNKAVQKNAIGIEKCIASISHLLQNGVLSDVRWCPFVVAVWVE